LRWYKDTCFLGIQELRKINLKIRRFFTNFIVLKLFNQKRNMKLVIPFSVLVGVLLINSCKKVDDIEDPLPANDLEVTVTPYFGTQKLYLDSVYTTDENYKMQFQEIRFYTTYMKNGANSLSDVALFNYKQTGNAFIKTTGDIANFTSLTADLGIDSSRNHADPSAFSSTNPLNIITANDMHWGWNPGYIFMYIDAKIDTIPDGVTNLDHFVSFHVGADQYKQSLSFPTVNWVKINSDLHRANLILDLKKFIYQPVMLDLKNENISHTAVGQEAISQKVIVNFANALRFE
jgi:hypothetical protein